MKKRNRKQQVIDALNAVKAKRRLDEIEDFGHSVNRPMIVKNKKKYTRKEKHRKPWN